MASVRQLSTVCLLLSDLPREATISRAPKPFGLIYLSKGALEARAPVAVSGYEATWVPEGAISMKPIDLCACGESISAHTWRLALQGVTGGNHKAGLVT
jgi:hypothetical protein